MEEEEAVLSGYGKEMTDEGASTVEGAFHRSLLHSMVDRVPRDCGCSNGLIRTGLPPSFCETAQELYKSPLVFNEARTFSSLCLSNVLALVPRPGFPPLGRQDVQQTGVWRTASGDVREAPSVRPLLLRPPL